jgi:carboxylesterase
MGSASPRSSSARHSGGPFELGPGPDACLLLHGLTGSTAEVRPLGERLAAEGWRVVAPILPGHGGAVEDLARVGRADLLAAASAALRDLRLQGARRIALAGLSAGALLAVLLASNLRTRGGDPELSRLALLAPALRLRGLGWLATHLFGHLPFARALPLSLPKGPRDLAAAHLLPAGDDGSLAALPVGWTRELRLLAREAWARAPRVRTPTLLLQGLLDKTVDPAGAWRLAGRLGAQRVAIETFPRSGHLLPLDVEGGAVCASVARFFSDLPGQQQP